MSWPSHKSSSMHWGSPFGEHERLVGEPGASLMAAIRVLARRCESKSLLLLAYKAVDDENDAEHNSADSCVDRRVRSGMAGNRVPWLSAVTFVLVEHPILDRLMEDDQKNASRDNDDPGNDRGQKHAGSSLWWPLGTW